jgi:hypothetical protein
VVLGFESKEARKLLAEIVQTKSNLHKIHITRNITLLCEISGSHGGEYEV